LRALPPQGSASTNFATCAHFFFYNYAERKIKFQLKERLSRSF